MNGTNSVCNGTFFKVMHRGTLLNLIHPTIRRLVNEVPSEDRCWVIMSALHVLNMDAKVMRNEISDVFHAKHDFGKIMSVKEYTSRRKRISRIYNQVLSLLVQSMPKSTLLNTSYQFKLAELDEEEFHKFVRSVFRTVAEFEAGGSDVVAYRRDLQVEM